MANGGKRPGAGRKKGGKNKRTLAAEALRTKLLEEGDSPLEVMIGNMRTAQRKAAKVVADLDKVTIPANASPEQLEAAAQLAKEARLLMMAAHECAKDAAPYLHPKLANIEVEGSMTLTWEDALEALDE
jgi:D-arabinose 1-dehydrogenase-like Zn-dependent alcohol dehydrogenase